MRLQVSVSTVNIALAGCQLLDHYQGEKFIHRKPNCHCWLRLIVRHTHKTASQMLHDYLQVAALLGYDRQGNPFIPYSVMLFPHHQVEHFNQSAPLIWMENCHFLFTGRSMFLALRVFFVSSSTYCNSIL